MFGLVIPGRPFIAVTTEDAPGSNRWIVDVSAPGEISEISVFLTQALVRGDIGVGIYFSFTCDSWEFLGVITNTRPSDIYSTGWSLRPDIYQLPATRIGFMVEDTVTLIPKLEVKPIIDIKKEYARRTALNLFRFIESFAQVGADRTIRCPQDVLDRWLVRFEEKFKIDPNFVLKTE
eukprot:GHVR01042004.1.p1 GENE.GHVR01042004.1~~GHVR01042004.1.p1  ORF type:complete len:177 (+),score=26.95 GHVR01042004.1:26-556(+)